MTEDFFFRLPGTVWGCAEQDGKKSSSIKQKLCLDGGQSGVVRRLDGKHSRRIVQETLESRNVIIKVSHLISLSEP